jgi:hypothetical protein
MKQIILLACFIASAAVTAQKPEASPYLYSKSHFSIGVRNGINKSSFESTIGTQSPESRIGYVRELSFGYQLNPSPRFGIAFNTGFGGFDRIFDVKSFENFTGTESYAYNATKKTRFMLFYEMEGTVRFQLSKKIVGFTGFGFGAKFFDTHTAQSSWSYNTGQLVEENVFFKSSWKYYLPLRIGIEMPLWNQDLISFGLGGTYSFSNIFNGTYAIYNATSTGTYFNKGHTLSFLLNYTFTRARKTELREELTISNGYTSKEARKELKKDKRYIDPKSIFFEAGGGLYFIRDRVVEKNNLIYSSSQPSWILYANTEIGWKDNLFFAGGFALSENWNSFRYQSHPLNISAMALKTSISGKFSGGIGFRFINPKNNKNYITLQTGIGLSLNLKEYFYLGTGGAYTPGDYYYDFYYYFVPKSKVGPSFYVQISKDIKLTQNTYLSFQYRFDQGMLPVSQIEMYYRTSPDVDHSFTKIIMNGTSSAFTISLKYSFVPKQK